MQYKAAIYLATIKLYLAKVKIAEIYGILRRERDNGAAVLVVSSDLEEVTTVADRVGVMVSGRLVSIHDADRVAIDQIAREIGGGTA